MVNPEFEARLRAMETANNDPLREHLGSLPAVGRPLPADAALVSSAFSGMVEQFAWTWLVGSGDGTGRTVSDDEAVDLLTDRIHHGIAGQR